MYLLWITKDQTGCIANSAMQITSAPATIAVSINHDNFTNECIRKSGRFAVSILSENTPSDLIGQFGFHSGKDINKFVSRPISTVSELPTYQTIVADMSSAK